MCVLQRPLFGVSVRFRVNFSFDGFLDNVSSVLSEFSCKAEKSWMYNRVLFLRCGKALANSMKSFVRVNARGIVCMQHLLNDDAESPLFVDCFLHPLETIEDNVS